MPLSKFLENFTHAFARWAGSATGFAVALGSVVIWLIAGGICDFSQRWENGLGLYIGIVTFLMVFLIQRGQVKELMALQVKLNELINASFKADNRLINLEELSEEEISEVKQMHQDKVPEKPTEKT